jgi:hypothetical protein
VKILGLWSRLNDGADEITLVLSDAAAEGTDHSESAGPEQDEAGRLGCGGDSEIKGGCTAACTECGMGTSGGGEKVGRQTGKDDARMAGVKNDDFVSGADYEAQRTSGSVLGAGEACCAKGREVQLAVMGAATSNEKSMIAAPVVVPI